MSFRSNCILRHSILSSKYDHREEFGMMRYFRAKTISLLQHLCFCNLRIRVYHVISFNFNMILFCDL
jgi:hypothetical protein